MADHTTRPAMADEQVDVGEPSSNSPETMTTRGPHDAGVRATPYSSSRPPSRGSTTSASSRTDMLAPQHSAGFMTPRSAASSGIGPQRHRRPLTKAEFHQQLETEQEATVGVLCALLANLSRAWRLGHYPDSPTDFLPGEPTIARTLHPPCSASCHNPFHR